MGSEFDGQTAKIGGKLAPSYTYPDVTVKLPVKGYQRLGIRELAPRTHMESQMWKIPIRDETVSKSGGGLSSYRGIIEGDFGCKESIAQIIKYREDMKPNQTVVEAKRRKPVAVPDIKTIKEKNVAINLTNPNEVRLDDLSFNDQKRVVGSSNILSEQPPKVYSAIDIPAGGYDIKKPRRLTMTEGQKINMLEQNAQGYARYINKVKPGENPFVIDRRADRRTNNDVQLVRKINFNNKYQDGLFNTTF